MNEVGKRFYFNLCLRLIFVAMNAFFVGKKKGKLVVVAASLGAALSTFSSIVKT